MHVKVKICGITRKKDVLNAIKAGADMVGFIVATPESPRSISIEKANEFIRLASHENVETVIVCTSTDENIIHRIYNSLNPSAIQVYKNFNLKSVDIKKFLAVSAFNITENKAVKLIENYDAIIIDTQLPGKPGGTGITHNWQLTRKIRDAVYPKPIFIAGGLTPENVEKAVFTVKPFGVDVSSGVESSLGIKDYDKMVKFVNNAKKVEI